MTLQEMMSRRTKKIHKITKYPYRDLGPRGKWFRINSGLEILSEYPFLETNEVVFNKCKGTDCLSRKGVQHVRVKIPGLPFPIDIYNTHINENGKNRAHIIHAQIEQFNNFIEKTHDPKLPMIMLGDFNFLQFQTAYSLFTSKYNPKNAAKECGLNLSCEGHSNPYDLWLKNLLDHQFYHPGNSGRITMTPIYYDHYFTDVKVGKIINVDLSDHPGVMVHYLIEY